MLDIDMISEGRSEDRAPLIAAVRRYYKGCTRIFVSPTMRLGASDTRVYRVRVKCGRKVVPQAAYAKVGLQADIKVEWDAFEQWVHRQLTNVPTPTKGGGANSRRWCICYPEVGHLADETRPFIELLEGKDYSWLPGVCDALKTLYTKHLQPWGGSPTSRQINWFQEYERKPPESYLRWSKLKTFVEQRHDAFNDSNVRVGRHCLHSPLRLLRDLRRNPKRWRHRVRTRPVHGDLHLRNLFLEKHGHVFLPWLIDFGWTRRFHCMVDYALLEASLKIFHFGRHFSEKRYLELHDQLAEHHTSGKAACLSTDEAALVQLIETIRLAAREEALDWPYEYYMSSCLISLGLMTVRTSPVRTAWITASWFAERIATSSARK